MIAAPPADAQSQPAVTPTRPAKIPFSVSESDGLRYLIQLVTRAAKPPAQAARLVVRKTCEIAI